MLKLHLGCGSRKLHGYINIDIREESQPDVVMDITKISKRYFECVDVIYSSHVLEHLPRKPFKMSEKTYKEVLLDWNKALKVGGQIRISVPDIAAVAQYIVETGQIGPVQSFLWGGAKHDYDFHYHGWTFESLKADLIEAGFEDVERYDWKATDHFFVDDYSQSYIPHMNKTTGRLMSLNVQAYKK